MVLPLWRSLHSINLMLPKEDRRALLLRLFNDTTPLVNANHNQQAARASTPDSPGDKPAVPVDTETVADSDITYAQIEKDILPPAATTEEDVIKRENLALGQEEQDLMATRETWQRNGDEQDKFNTTV
jgi:multisite-specific tRNA:(cytosine-C5)-methyltransferase